MVSASEICGGVRNSHPLPPYFRSVQRRGEKSALAERGCPRARRASRHYEVERARAELNTGSRSLLEKIVIANRKKAAIEKLRNTAVEPLRATKPGRRSLCLVLVVLWHGGPFYRRPARAPAAR